MNSAHNTSPQIHEKQPTLIEDNDQGDFINILRKSVNPLFILRLKEQKEQDDHVIDIDECCLLEPTNSNLNVGRAFLKRRNAMDLSIY